MKLRRRKRDNDGFICKECGKKYYLLDVLDGIPNKSFCCNMCKEHYEAEHFYGEPKTLAQINYKARSEGKTYGKYMAEKYAKKRIEERIRNGGYIFKQI